MMSTLSIASWGLLFGAMGQWAFYIRLFPRLPIWLLMGVLLIPWLTVFITSFCNSPPFGPRPFRHCLEFAMCWYAGLTVLAETLYVFVQPPPRGNFSLIAARVLIYGFGVVSFMVFVRACITLRRYETKPDA